MKISELVKRTGVPKETIHFYIREGLLRKPRKSGVNAADYNERYVDQVLLIKDLRDNYYLPIPEIKKVIKDFKRQSFRKLKKSSKILKDSPLQTRPYRNSTANIFVRQTGF
jgi:DNA-binding transcriptional MerR regulator